jgi:threonine/homoserine/homoserine lactone efflux protein
MTLWNRMTLEDRYTRLIKLFPKDWRAAHGDDLLGTLMDSAGSGAVRVPFAEAVSLVGSATAAHTRRVMQSPWQLFAWFIGVLCIAALTKFGIAGVPLDFALTSVVVAAIPGTGVFYTVSTAIGSGSRRGLLAAVGCTLGIIPHMAAAMLGLSGIMQVGATVFEIIKYVGVAYLVFMGASILRDRGDLFVSGDGSPSGSPFFVVRRGVLLNLLNPKLTVFFFAFLPPFLDDSPSLFDVRLVGLGAVFMIATFIVFAVYAYGSAAIRDQILSAPIARRWLQRVLGGLLVGFGIRLAISD